LIKGKVAEEMQHSFARTLRATNWYRPGLKLGAAVSGGADSVALLALLAAVRAELGLVISAVHFNHRLRGKASDADEKFVTAFAEQCAVTLHIGRADVAAKARRDKSNLEETARRSRYSFFEKLVQQGLVDAVLTAHSMDDQAETVLAHILRGTGLAGLAGIQPVAGSIRRPLLDFRREALRQYLRAKKQPWREDASNRDTLRTRARMRKKLLPLLTKEFNPASIEHLSALAARALEQSSFLEHLTAQLFPKLVQQDSTAARITIAALSDPLGFGCSASISALQKALLEKIVDHVKPRRGQLSAEHLAAILRLAQNPETGKSLQLPGGVDVLRERSALLFRSRS